MLIALFGTIRNMYQNDLSEKELRENGFNENDQSGNGLNDNDLSPTFHLPYVLMALFGRA